MNHPLNGNNPDDESAELGFKRLTSENVQLPDPVVSAFVRYSMQDDSIQTVSTEEWAQIFLSVELSEHVPLEVRQLFAVARGTLVYGFFFYPLYTLGAEQMLRVAETAVAQKCRDVGVSAKKLERMSYRKRVKRLAHEGVFEPTAQLRWNLRHELRNLASHPEDQSIFTPGFAIDELKRIASDIDGLFPDC